MAERICLTCKHVVLKHDGTERRARCAKYEGPIEADGALEMRTEGNPCGPSAALWEANDG